ncbi:GNAT family N-acetyltransferase [Jannaschia sp.]|nr:GNAT family N-acetyltransferase [Jannaschia sp.]
MLQADTLAALHAQAFTGAARWSAAAFEAALTDTECFFATRGAGPDGFALGRAIAGEAELLTLVVADGRRRSGLGRALLLAFEAEAARRGAEAAFLEVAADNTPARDLYAGAGWRLVGKRTGYYGGIDALAMRKDL